MDIINLLNPQIRAAKEAFEKSEREIDRLSRMSFEDAEKEIGVRDTKPPMGFFRKLSQIRARFVLVEEQTANST